MKTKPSTRILALALEAIADFQHRPTKNSGIYAALDRRLRVVGTVIPKLSLWDHYVNKLRGARASMVPPVFRRRTAIAERDLQQWEGKYDVIVQLQTMCAPGLRYRERPYTLYTDNIYSLTRRYYPAWAPLRRHEAQRWMELEGSACRHARFVFAKSEFLRQALIEDYGCDPARVVTVGAGANNFVVSLQHKRYEAPIALFVGAEFHRKGGAVLLKAWDMVRRRLPEAQLWIVGPARPRGDNRPGVRWCGYCSERGLLSEIYMQARFFVLPSLFEPLGLSFLDAMGHGLSCIGASHCAMPEIIHDDVNGLLVPPGQPEPLAEALFALLNDRERAEAMGRRAHQVAMSTYTWDHVAARMLPHIEKIATESAQRRTAQGALSV